MTLLQDTLKALDESRRQFDRLMASDARRFYADEEYDSGRIWGENAGTVTGNRIACGDNLEYMAHLIKNEDMGGRIQLIYADPPFFSKGGYDASFRLDSELLGRSELIKTAAYDDRQDGGPAEYLTMLAVRFMMMRELLSDSGCLWVHLDWHMVHYVKAMLDSIFGEENFINEVIWTYKSGGSNARSFAKKHDTLLFYGKGPDYHFDALKEKSYNRERKPYRFKGVEEFQDEEGWYTVVNMKDVWQIDMVGRTSSERNGYATQKPEKLLERIVDSCSREGDICADFFGGSGTLGAVCQRRKRRWMMCDAGDVAAMCQISRMARQKADFTVERAEGGSRRGDGALEAVLEGGKIRLKSYDRADAEDLDDEMKRYLKEDSLSLVRLWSVDLHYDGMVHRPEAVMMNGERECDARGLDKQGDISIKGYDASGGEFFLVI